MPADDRDPKFERALAQHLRGDSAAACPDAETLAAFHERSLSLEEMAHWKQHISGCAACQETLALVETAGKQLAEDWEEKKIPVLAATEKRPVPARAIAAGREQTVSEDASAATAAPAEILRRRRPLLLRWAVPLGAVAAGVLVWIGIHEQHAPLASKSSALQVAQNLPAPAPEQKLTDKLQSAQPMERDDREAQLAEEAVRKRAESYNLESRRVSPPVVTGRPEPSANDSELAEKESAGRTTDALGPKTAPAPPPPPPPAAPSQTTATSPLTEPVEVSAAPPAAPAPAPVSSSGGVTAGVGGGMGVADTQSVTDAKKEKSLNKRAANDLDTSAMMKKQGVNGRDVDALRGLVPAPAMILTPDNRVWWKLGSGGTLELTTDGGKAWKSVDTGAAGQLTAGSAPSAEICWIAGRAGTLLLTSDRGVHWKVLNTPIAGDLGGVRATDAKHANIWDAARQQGFLTSDGGVTWTQTTP